MTLIDVLIPLAIGLLLVLRPESFLKKSGSQVEIARKSATLRKIGYVLVVVAALYAVFTLV
jgi:hypothetical protein